MSPKISGAEADRTCSDATLVIDIRADGHVADLVEQRAHARLVDVDVDTFDVLLPDERSVDSHHIALRTISEVAVTLKTIRR